MIRFLDCRVYCVEYENLCKEEIQAYFLNGHKEDIICVMDKGKYIGIIEYGSIQEDEDIYNGIQHQFLVMDKSIWNKGRSCFAQNKSLGIIPVLDGEKQLLCFAWQDEEANRELRMLCELESCEDAITFNDLNPDKEIVTIHGCNELAWAFAQYIQKCGIAINVDGKEWEELGIKERHESVVDRQYEIWAEGVHTKSANWKQERFKSASVEFECIDEIYEANIKAGKIADADGDSQMLLERLSHENQIVIRGTGTKAQDAYNWLLSNGIDICAFQSEKVYKGRTKLFGRPILRKIEIEKQYGDAIIIECASKYSTWGFGDVDRYAYEGYERNRKYILLRDYIDVPECNLRYVLENKNVLLFGDVRLCSRIYKWLIQQQEKVTEIGYWNILEEKGELEKRYEIPFINGEKINRENCIYLLVVPKYSRDAYITREAAYKSKKYIEKLICYGVDDYTDYFSDMVKSIHIEAETIKYSNKFRPAGILLGAITDHSGNVLFRQSLSGHPQIIMIEEYGYLNEDLYSVCIRLAEEKTENIMSGFWEIYQDVVPWAVYDKDTEMEAATGGLRDKKIFHNKMEELLKQQDKYTAQELFVIIHLAYISMYDQEIDDLRNKLIYWEPHQWDRKIVREFAFWLGSDCLEGYTINIVRNRYALAGSRMKGAVRLGWQAMARCMYGCERINADKKIKNWKECTLRFEELKCRPQETLASLCSWLGISFLEILMETNRHGKIFFYDGTITGFDVRPAHNLYEEYFSSFDRMRICLLAGSYERQYEYPYVNCMSFSRRELQNFFLKEFRWEGIPEIANEKKEEQVWQLQKRFRYYLWLERFAEVMGKVIDEEY